MYLIDKPSLPRINVSISTLYNYTMFSKHWPHAEEITISICRLPVLAVQKNCSNNGNLIRPKTVFFWIWPSWSIEVKHSAMHFFEQCLIETDGMNWERVKSQPSKLKFSYQFKFPQTMNLLSHSVAGFISLSSIFTTVGLIYLYVQKLFIIAQLFCYCLFFPESLWIISTSYQTYWA